MTKAYALFGNNYARYDVESDGVDPGYPKLISAGWTGAAGLGFGEWIDTALDLGAGKAYFFKGSDYIRVDQSSNRVDDGYPLPIAGNWPGLAEAGFASDLDASANWGDGTVYFFKGNQTLRYNIAADRAEADYPRSIGSEFPSLADSGFDSGVQAVVMWPSGNAYFFRGADYVRLDRDGTTYSATNIASAWPGLAGPIDAMWVRLTGARAPVVTGNLEPGDHVWYWNGQISRDLNIPRKAWFGHMPGYEPNNSTDYRGNGKDIYNFVIHANGEIRRGRPHMKNHEGTYGWLNNNPGNLTAVVNTSHNYGQYYNKFNWHNFMIFPTMEAGSQAILPFILDRWSSLSIHDAMAKYAPASDGNDPVAYAASLAAAAGVPVTTVFGTLTPAQKDAVSQAITRHEGVREGVVLHRDSPELPEAIRSML